MTTTLREIAAADETVDRTLHLQNPKGLRFSLDVTFYTNRVDGAPDVDDDSDDLSDEDETERTAQRLAEEFCTDIVAAWDLEGPMLNRRGEEVIGPGVVALEASVIRLLPPWLVQAVREKFYDLLFPNRNGSRRGRRR